MAKNYLQPGNVLDLIAKTGGVISGSGYFHGVIFAIAQVTAAATKVYAGSVRGVHLLPKNTGMAFTEGEKVGFDESAQECVTSGDVNSDGDIGAAVKAQDAADTTMEVMLTP